MSRLNRTLLAVLGLLLVLAGAAALVIASGRVLAVAGVLLPDPSTPIVPSGRVPAVTSLGSAALLAGGAVLLAALAIGWLLTAVPRRGSEPPFRLHEDTARGTTVLAPAALDEAVEEQVRGLPGVARAGASIRGAAQAPRASLRLTVDERADLAAVVRTVCETVTDGLALSFGAKVDRLGVLVDVDRMSRTADVAEVPRRTGDPAATGPVAG